MSAVAKACIQPGCGNNVLSAENVKCDTCITFDSVGRASNYDLSRRAADKPKEPSMAEKYPQYYKAVPKGISDADTYVINMMFPIDSKDDPTGTVLHARKKLLVPGCRTGGKTFYQDVKEARDTLNRFLDLMDPNK